MQIPFKTSLSVFAVLLVLTGQGCLLIPSDSDQTQTGDSAATADSTDIMAAESDSLMAQENENPNVTDNANAGSETQDAGSYETYAPDKLASANTGDVVLFFRASWCPSCKVLDADIRANLKNIPAGLIILDVNYDTETELKKKYGVTYQHTFVQVDAEGNQIAKWSGSSSLESLAAKVQ